VTQSPEANLHLDAARVILATAYRTGAAIEAALAPLGIGLRDYDLLARLGSMDPPVQTVLGDLLGIDRSTMVGVIDRLQKADLVERRRDPADRRAWRVHLTQHGAVLLPRAAEAAERAAAEALAPISEKGLRTLLRAYPNGPRR